MVIRCSNRCRGNCGRAAPGHVRVRDKAQPLAAAELQCRKAAPFCDLSSPTNSMAGSGLSFYPGSDRGALLHPGRMCGVESPVARFDASSPFVSGNHDPDVVGASALACSGDFLLRFAGR
jgi:hypothetical protein